MSLNTCKYVSKLTSLRRTHKRQLIRELVPLASPEILKTDIADVTTFDSLPLSWTVEADGIPRPAVIWYHNGEEVKASDRIRFTDSGVS